MVLPSIYQQIISNKAIINLVERRNVSSVSNKQMHKIPQLYKLCKSFKFY